jgi:hypothetical protein
MRFYLLAIYEADMTPREAGQFARHEVKDVLKKSVDKPLWVR